MGMIEKDPEEGRQPVALVRVVDLQSRRVGGRRRRHAHDPSKREHRASRPRALAPMLSMLAGWHKEKTRSVLLCAHVTRGGLSRPRSRETDSDDRKVMVMRVFVAGGTGVIGRRLVPQLVARGHQVTATTTSAAKMGLLEQLGAEAVVMDGLDAVSVGEAVAAGRAGRDRAPDDRDLGGARRQARYQAHGPLVRHHQPAAHRGDRPPAGRRRGDRRLPRRRAELRQLERRSARAGG